MLSFHNLTIDDFMQLDRKALAFALRLFQKELNGTIAFLHESEEARQDEQLLDDLQHLLTLRKVFQVRLDEVLAEEQAAQAPEDTSTQVLAAA